MFHEALSVTHQLEEINRHHETPAAVLGMTGQQQQERISLIDRVEHQHLAELSDGSHLYRMDAAVYALLREGLPPGSLLETGIMSVPTISGERIGAFLSFATVAIVLRHDIEQTHLLGLTRTPRAEEAANGMRQGAWDTYTINGLTYREKDDAYHALLRLFSPTQGIEGSQMLSSLFSRTMVQTGGSEARISEAGCFSHEKPLQAVPLNLLLGTTQPLPLRLTPHETNRIVRLRLAPDGNAFATLAAYGTTGEENHILTMGLIRRAEQVAAGNPLQLGNGTEPDRVLTAMLETTIRLPELVGNDATTRQATEIFRQELGLR